MFPDDRPATQPPPGWLAGAGQVTDQHSGPPELCWSPAVAASVAPTPQAGDHPSAGVQETCYHGVHHHPAVTEDQISVTNCSGSPGRTASHPRSHDSPSSQSYDSGFTPVHGGGHSGQWNGGGHHGRRQVPASAIKLDDHNSPKDGDRRPSNDCLDWESGRQYIASHCSSRSAAILEDLTSRSTSEDLTSPHLTTERYDTSHQLLEKECTSDSLDSKHENPANVKPKTHEFPIPVRWRPVPKLANQATPADEVSTRRKPNQEQAKTKTLDFPLPVRWKPVPVAPKPSKSSQDRPPLLRLKKNEYGTPFLQVEQKAAGMQTSKLFCESLNILQSERQNREEIFTDDDKENEEDKGNQAAMYLEDRWCD